MELKPEDKVIYNIEVKPFSVEMNQSGFIPGWFQSKFANLINKILQDNLKHIHSEDEYLGKELEKEALEESQDQLIAEQEDTNNEYVNWEHETESNHFTISGTIKYETKTKILVCAYISRGEAIKFSRDSSYEIDNVLDDIPDMLVQIKKFIFSTLKTEQNMDNEIDVQQYYLEVFKLLENDQDNQSAEKHFVAGLFMARTGHEENALENLDYVINNSANPEIIQDCYKVILNVKAKKNMKDLELAQNEVDKGDPLKAIPLIESLIQITPKYIHLHFLLGAAYKRSGQREMAIEAFKKVLEIDNNHISSIRALAEELIALGKLSEVESMYNRIVNLNLANAADYYNLGMCLKRLGKTEHMDEIMEKIKELDLEGRFDSYLFNLFEIKPEHLEDHNKEKKTLWSKFFGKK